MLTAFEYITDTVNAKMKFTKNENRKMTRKYLMDFMIYFFGNLINEQLTDLKTPNWKLTIITF